MRLTLLILLTTFLVPLSADPKSHYMIHCMGCHLINGQGIPPEVPQFNEDLAYLAGSEDGRRYLVQVPGASQAPIDDAELAELLNWMLQKYAQTKTFTHFDENEISSHRADILADPKSERARLFATTH